MLGCDMNTNTDNMKSRVQETLDELLTEHLIPFALTAYKVDAIGCNEYVVPFYDSRVRSVNFFWRDGDVKPVIRTAVLACVKRIHSPFKNVACA